MRHLILTISCGFLISTLFGQDVLIIHDNGSTFSNTVSLKDTLDSEGFDVTITTVNESNWNNTNPSVSGFDAVIHLNGTSYASEMPQAGQIALNDFVEDDEGLYIGFEWNSYQRFVLNELQNLDDLILFQRTSGATGSPTHTISAGQTNHPVLSGVPNSFSVYDGYNIGNLRTLSGSTLLMQSGSNPLVAVRDFGQGHILNFAMAANYSQGNSTVLTNSHIQTIIINFIREYAFNVEIIQDSSILCYGDSTAVLSADVIGGDSPYTYLWSNGDTSLSISGLDTGTYGVTVTDSVGDQTSNSFIVSEPTELIASLGYQENILCPNDSNGIAFVATNLGGIQPYTYAWNDGSINDTNTNLPLGPFTCTVSDSNNCISTYTGTIVSLDITAPTAVGQNLTVYLDASGSASITAAQVDNGSSDNCSVDSLYLDQTDFDCSDTVVNEVTLTAVDASGNSSSVTADITVLDTISPTMASQNLTVYLDATGGASITAAQVDSGSSDNCSVDLSLSPSDFTCMNEGSNTVAMIGVDPSGNTTIDSFIVEVVDTLFEVSAIQGTESLPQGAVHSYYVDSIAGAVYQWSVVNGTLSANGASSEVTWNQDSLSGQISVIQTVEQGCLDSTSQVITLWLTGIDNLSLSEQINLFPNPTRDKVNLSLNQGRLEQVEVRVYANDGRLVLTQSNLTLNQSNHEIDLSQFARGQYTIVVSQAEKANQYKVILN
ncbi:MAG: T9SS type A sorting domain-containing protein [Flavobacteriales bacterium]|nr:T9SS type A sorting domain-containing protein [Flavobacteriales bacterium]